MPTQRQKLGLGIANTVTVIRVVAFSVVPVLTWVHFFTVLCSRPIQLKIIDTDIGPIYIFCHEIVVGSSCCFKFKHFKA